MSLTIFKPGDRVIPTMPLRPLEKGAIYQVAAVIDLPNPGGLLLNPHRWAGLSFAEFTGVKTRRDSAGHPQRLFFDEFLDEDLPSDAPDPEGKNRTGFSGALFKLAIRDDKLVDLTKED